jgi:protoporphyrinogen oxidase
MGETARAYDVLVLGGGLSGLAAAWALEQRGIGYAIVEVKDRLGGSIITTEHAGYTLDGTHFMLEKNGDWPFLGELGLPDSALVQVGRYRMGHLVCFRHGTETLVRALAAQVRAPLLLRMAAASIGPLPDGRWGVCLENGVLLTARAVIVALPARYAARVLASWQPEAAFFLGSVAYEPTVRVSAGFAAADVPGLPANSDTLKVDWAVRDPRIRFVHAYTLPDRVPQGGRLLRVGVRVEGGESEPPTPEAVEAAAALGRAVITDGARVLNAAAEPVFTAAHFWPEADPLGLGVPEQVRGMAVLKAALPPTLAVIGSDTADRAAERYLERRIHNAHAAVRRIAEDGLGVRG